MMNFVYFDIETERLASEVGGWQNIEQLGLAVAVTNTSHSDEFRAFRKESAQELLAELRAADCVVGFNTRHFDFRVLQPYVDFDVKTLTNIDLMLDLKDVAGFRPGLNNCCAATFGENKSSGGVESVQWWREGRFDEVIAYCQQDVALTRKLHEWGAQHGWVKCLDRAGRVRTLQVGWSLDSIVAAPQQGSLF
ncbi:MAG TPA: ribonuclease H-like domain-containing protein [Abditibacteriaceae bacterium]|jgi:DEAD/DEAH box helicase domain-containing protein